MIKTINLGVLAHVDAGKTTVTEGLLVHCGVKPQMGRVDHGTTTTDSMALERQRGMTIRASTVSFTYNNIKVNLIDTPGHMDFIAEVERSLSVLDGVVLVISAKEGVQPQTRVIFRKLRAMHIPTLLFVNKIDRLGVSIEEVLADVREHLTADTLVMQRVTKEGSREVAVKDLPLNGDAQAEALIERDETLLEAYLEGREIPVGMLHAALRTCVRSETVFPLYMGAALHDIGIAPLLDAITSFFGHDAEAQAPLSALIYKVEWDAKGHKLLYARVFSGILPIRGQIAVAGGGVGVKVRGLLAAQDGRLVATEQIMAGDIGVLLDAPGIRCGDWIGEETVRTGVTKPAPPLLTVSIRPVTSADRSALLTALGRLTEEDPFLDLAIRAETGEITLRLFGALQLEIIQSLLLERFGLTAEFSPLMTRFAEKPSEATIAQMRIWSEGNLHEAGIVLQVEPLETGAGNLYETQVSYGDLERSFQNAVEEGVLMGLQEGIGQEIVDTKVTFLDMDYSSVTSTPADFRRLAPLVLQKALRTAGLIRLEPWLSYTVSAPLEQRKRVLSALTGLRASLEEVTYAQEEMHIRGEVPLDTCKAFAAELQSLTQGKGIFQTEFLEYRQTQTP